MVRSLEVARFERRISPASLFASFAIESPIGEAAATGWNGEDRGAIGVLGAYRVRLDAAGNIVWATAVEQARSGKAPTPIRLTDCSLSGPVDWNLRPPIADITDGLSAFLLNWVVGVGRALGVESGAN